MCNDYGQYWRMDLEGLVTCMYICMHWYNSLEQAYATHTNTHLCGLCSELQNVFINWLKHKILSLIFEPIIISSTGIITVFDITAYNIVIESCHYYMYTYTWPQQDHKRKSQVWVMEVISIWRVNLVNVGEGLSHLIPLHGNWYPTSSHWEELYM